MAPTTNSDPTVPLTSSTASYKELLIERITKYDSSTPAAGLFYISNAGQPSCRIEATGKRIEFVDVAEFGVDPDGTLYYNNLKDLSGPMQYRFWHNTVTKDDEAAVVAQFYKRGSNTFIAEFVGNDPARTVNTTVSDHTGNWRPFSFQENTASINKSAGSTTITLNINIINRRATWSVPDSARNVTINQGGKVLIKNLSDIAANKTSHVDYNDDRAIFYPQVHSTDFSVVFLPIISNGEDVHGLHSQQVGTNGGSWRSVTWA